ncbi:GNAT family N-acetyltransferase [Amycolatopsis acidiphila]|uniref:GNAT family N-acetyltransferase n=1 Tax=Amycolatopsis acidiphila TaxID=715473 RepID=A0A558A9R8_9PSEU|nr:GNAT family N-acetyltransferase [Amycolatopsis acidiphila]TVT21005.1 GNAT family N-acetyltransferase [Amycolatopsis acidiphila]UIJ61335.1 GNAT family N-acetyltransferase [Amycolatopsis acidiphila]GHG78156.1 GNAT family acetyltransferase [Amycolatopsis acidiphila]
MTVEFADIRTERLLLRRLTEADREAVVRIQTDPRTNRYHPEPPDAAEGEAKFDSWLRDWDHDGFCYLPVRELPGEQIVGVGGLQLRKFSTDLVLNLYYRFLPEVWGRGYATEMATAVIAWADRTLPQYPVQISVSVQNQPSLNVAKRLGFQTYLETIHDGALSRHFRRD